MSFDVIVIGGSFAGLSAALQVARARRQVLVIDAGKPRNRFSPHAHGFFAQDGVPPLTLIGAGREKVLAYPNVRFLQGEATEAQRNPQGLFTVRTAAGEAFEGKRLILAHGMVDDLPQLPGLRERWGDSVHLCPYCHGYESNRAPLGVLWVSPLSAHQASLLPEWGPVTFFTEGNEPDAEALSQLEARGVHVERSKITELLGTAPKLTGVRVASGRVYDLVALYIGTRARFASPLAAQLGCAIEEGPTGPKIRTDEWKLTSVPGVFAAGDITRMAPNATWASSDGVTAGVACHRSLVFG
jgi:thioredoxin reductase